MTPSLALLVLIAPAPDHRPGPAADVPELKVLDAWAGRWTTEMTLGSEADAKPIRGEGEAEWILDGRFLRQSWTLAANETSPLQSGQLLMTYEPAKGGYRGWWFFSSGFGMDCQGTWDAAKRTMLWTTRDAASGQTTTVTSSFVQPDRQEWSIATKNPDGTSTVVAKGVNVRKKD